MLLSPIIGVIGGKYSRKMIIIFGVIVWVGSLVGGSFIETPVEVGLPGNSTVSTGLAPKCESDLQVTKKWYLLLTSRIFFGIGEVSYVTVAITTIHDLFTSEKWRNFWITVFVMGTPVGSGVGYMLGDFVVNLTGKWQDATVAGTPVTVTCLILFLFSSEVKHGYKDRVRNSSAGKNYEISDQDQPQNTETNKGEALDNIDTTNKAILKRLYQNKTYISIVIGQTCLFWVMGAATTFMPMLMTRAVSLNSCENNTAEWRISTGRIDFDENLGRSNSSLSNSSTLISCSGNCIPTPASEANSLFGIVAITSGIGGAMLGTYLEQLWKRKTNYEAASLYLSFLGLLSGSILSMSVIIFARQNLYLMNFIFFLGCCGMNMLWPLNTAATMDIVHPLDKTASMAILMTLGHLFGDVTSSMVVGKISDLSKNYFTSRDYWSGELCQEAKVSFYMVQCGCVVMPVVLLVGSFVYFFGSKYMKGDLEKLEEILNDPTLGDD